jgi:acetamidase/formamidase
MSRHQKTGEAMSRHHEIAPLPENMVWGYLDAAVPPVLKIASGDTVRLSSWAAADEEDLPPDRSLVDPGHLRAMRELVRGPASHMLTGPVYVEGVEPGDVLQIAILEITLADRWGFVGMVPLRGTLPEDFDAAPLVIHATIDRERRTCRLPWGLELALDPFFGILGVAPPAHWGRWSSVPPRKFGGNLDNKELRPGTTLYLPVFNDGALFYAGGHGVQGDGEVCLTALETALSGTFRLAVRKDLDFAFPFAENASHLISMGLNEDLDEAARQAVREMIAHICRRTSLAPHEAYMLCSLAGDLRVTQTVDGVKGCHMMLAKSLL